MAVQARRWRTKADHHDDHDDASEMFRRAAGPEQGGGCEGKRKEVGGRVVGRPISHTFVYMWFRGTRAPAAHLSAVSFLVWAPVCVCEHSGKVMMVN